MDKETHGRLLREAIGTRRLSREAVADHVHVTPRTVTNWRSGVTMPSPGERAALRELLGDYDREGDPVEVAIRRSDLIKWRQDNLIGEYERHRHEQAREEAG